MNEKIKMAVNSVLCDHFVNSNIVNHVFLIKVGNSLGTCFALDIDNKEYIVTAKHVVSTIAVNGDIEIFRESSWHKTHIHIIGHHKVADISVFRFDFRPDNISYTLTYGTNVCYGQDVYFLGFPYGMLQDKEADLVNGIYPMPLVKKATLSAVLHEDKCPMFILDGNNNPGFSGGPVIYYDFSKGVNRLLAVISGYKIDLQDMADEKGKPIPFPLKSRGNSGIIHSWSIECAVELIRNNPDGFPLK